jgi:hypothetical protein
MKRVIVALATVAFAAALPSAATADRPLIFVMQCEVEGLSDPILTAGSTPQQAVRTCELSGGHPRGLFMPPP